jgi:hypothetical protein
LKPQYDANKPEHNGSGGNGHEGVSQTELPESIVGSPRFCGIHDGSRHAQQQQRNDQ